MKNLTTTLTGLLAGSLLIVGCTKSNMQSAGVSPLGNNSSIVNGTNAATADVQPGSFANPVVAIFTLLDEKTGEGALCTGTLIAPTVVLTAGHCVEDATPTSKTYVSFQSLDWSNAPGLTVQAKSFVIHPNYAAGIKSGTSAQADDLALILLSKPAPASVTPATLASSSSVLSSLTGVTDVGFGQADDRHNTQADGAGELRYTQFTSDQLMVYSGAGALNGMIIADGEQTSVCHGDSGGPMFAGSPTDSTKLVVGVNDLVIPVYSGQEKTDYEAAEKAGSLDAFYAKYPDAHICLGYNAFVDVSAHLAWINQASAQLTAGN